MSNDSQLLPQTADIPDPTSNYSTPSSQPQSCLFSLDLEEVVRTNALQEITDMVTTAASTLPQTVSTSVMNTQCSSYCRSDSVLDDADRLMQILVGM